MSNYVTSCILSSSQCRGRIAGVRRSSIIGSIFFMRSMSSFRRSQTSHCSNYFRRRIMSLRMRSSSSNIFSLFNFIKYMVFHCKLASRHSLTSVHICLSRASWASVFTRSVNCGLSILKMSIPCCSRPYVSRSSLALRCSIATWAKASWVGILHKTGLSSRTSWKSEKPFVRSARRSVSMS